MDSRVGQRIAAARVAAGIRLEALDEFVSPQAVEEAVRSCGRDEKRWCACLPASAVVYFVLAMCLHFSDGYAEILRRLTDGLRTAVHTRALRVAGTSAVSKARARLGPGPLKVLFEQVRGPLTASQSPGAFAFSRRLLMLALDGTVLDVAPTPANIKAFGSPPGGSRKPGHYPQVKLVLLIACGTRGILDARFGPRRDNEVALAKQLATIPTLSGGQLVLMDRAFHGHDVLARITACGADFIVRAHSHHWLPHLRELADGSFLSCVADRASGQRQAALRFCNRRMPPGHPHGVAVRVVDADIIATPEHGPPRTRPLRVITSLLDPDQAPAQQIAAVYAERWNSETSLLEVKILQSDHRPLLRSQTPDGVVQEIYGLLITHQYLQAQRARAAQASLDPTTGQPLDPDRISFTAVLRTTRRHLHYRPAAGQPPLITLVQVEALAQLIPRRPHRVRPRARQAPNHRMRAPGPVPTGNVTYTITICRRDETPRVTPQPPAK
ncbi:IS4 family transposase [Streptomyces sp. NPDC051214]|uniref:IS4 family transposase n=1 Tax=Streptomyces sp. NPDC051214 TaxID=3155282 RepID=UPI003426F9C9